MATAKLMTYFKAKVQDRPGALLGLLRNLKDNNLGLVGLKGVSQGSHGDVLVIPKDPDKFRIAWNAAGLLLEEGSLFCLSGTDSTGALVSGFDALSKADVNVVAVEAGAVGGRYEAFVWVSPSDLEKAAKALGAK